MQDLIEIDWQIKFTCFSHTLHSPINQSNQRSFSGESSAVDNPSKHVCVAVYNHFSNSLTSLQSNDTLFGQHCFSAENLCIPLVDTHRQYCHWNVGNSAVGNSNCCVTFDCICLLLFHQKFKKSTQAMRDLSDISSLQSGSD